MDVRHEGLRLVGQLYQQESNQLGLHAETKNYPEEKKTEQKKRFLVSYTG